MVASPSTSTSNGSRRIDRSLPTLEAEGWRLLTPPTEDGEKIEVGVVEVHPSSNRVAYATRSRCDQSQDLGKTKIIVHDFDFDRGSRSDDSNDNWGGGRVASSFSLRELTKRINEFRAKSQFSAMTESAAHAHPREMLHSLATTPPATMPYTVQMLGAVQRLSFLSRDAVRSAVPPGYVREGQSRMQRLLIGFRRCAVVVSVFHLKQQSEESCARGVQVMAYIGPDDLDEYERDEKSGKRQPSSYPIPISENILAYGCYDGGIRFYDFVRRKQAKSALGPNGRSNPIVKVINANATQSNNLADVKRSMAAGCQSMLPKIISVCATGVAYLWELDLSIDIDSGEVLQFDIPPPLASFDGLVAAVSGKWGIPVKRPPTLSPTSIAALSPRSSWEQTDEVNAQFEVSFDPHRNLLFWVFSPDCVASSLAPHAPREERLNKDGALVCWELAALPRPEWPPPMLPPRCVMQLNRTADGKILSDMVLPGISGVLSSSHLTTIYITSSSELVGAVTDLEKQRDSILLKSSAKTLVDLKTLNHGHSYSIAISRFQSSLIAVGTQHGVFFVKISGSNGAGKQLLPAKDESTQQRSLPNCRPEKVATSTIHHEIYETKIRELESRNKELECELDGLRERGAMFLDERNRLSAQVEDLMEEHAKFCEISEMNLNAALSKAEALENDQTLKSQSCQALEAQVNVLQEDIDQISDMFEKEKQSKNEATLKIVAAEGRAKKMEKEVDATKDLMKSLQDECDNLRQQLNGNERVDKRERRESSDSRLTGDDYFPVTDSSDTLRKELFSAKETEEALRNYIALLEEDKETMDKELEDARQEAEEYAKKYDKATTNLCSDLREQKSAIDSLVDLLERQRNEHEEDNAAQNNEIRSLTNELSELKLKYQTGLDKTNELSEDAIAKLKCENASLKEDASIGNGNYLAMKVELQNALNDLAAYQHGHNGIP